MSILKSTHPKIDNHDQVSEEDDDKNPKFVSIILENNSNQTSPTPKLRSILRKHVEKKVSTTTSSNVQQTSTLINENDNNNERDSDYTGDEYDEEENNVSNVSVERKSQTNEQHFSRQQKKDQSFQRLSSTFPVNLSETTKARTEKSTNTVNDQSSNRTGCVTFANKKPTIIHPSSSTSPRGDMYTERLPSVTYINMKEDLPTRTTTTTTTTAMTSDFRPVYVSPLKYRPLLGLSANDSRLLLEKRVSLLGKPVVFHPIQKRSLSYRRTQLRIYNFLERADGYKAIIYHTFV
jgi:hypothetical protein